MKISKLASLLQQKNCDIALLYNSDSTKTNTNMFYFSGYSGLGALVVPKSKQPFLIVPEMEYEMATKSFVKAYTMDKKRFFESIYRIIKKNKIRAKNIAIDKNSFSLNSYKYFKKQFRKIKTKDISLDCFKLREIKTDKEINLLKKSCTYADKILQKAIKNFREFKTESEAAAFLDYETRKNGLELSFNPIVASGKNGSMPHHEPSNKKIKERFCVLDFGVKYKGYCSDITRTVFIGKPDYKEKKVYNFLLGIQKDAIDKVKNNINCAELYNFVVNSLGSYQKNFTHGLGHGVGVEIHELPNLTLNSKDKITDNMVFTIEPGIYFPKKFGLRIEDTVLFKKKAMSLTKTSKDLLII